MELSLGGTGRSDTGGMTSMAGRAVEEIAKPNAPEGRCPAAPEGPGDDRVHRRGKPRPRAGRSRDETIRRRRTPTTGAEIKTGAARVNTGGAAFHFGGLAQGGGGAGGVQLDVKNFCCPGYLAQMVQKDPSELERPSRAPAASRRSSSRFDATAC